MYALGTVRVSDGVLQYHVEMLKVKSNKSLLLKTRCIVSCLFESSVNCANMVGQFSISSLQYVTQYSFFSNLNGHYSKHLQFTQKYQSIHKTLLVCKIEKWGILLHLSLGILTLTPTLTLTTQNSKFRR